MKKVKTSQKKCKNRFSVALENISISSAYWMGIKSYDDLFYTSKSLPHFFAIKFSSGSKAMI